MGQSKSSSDAKHNDSANISGFIEQFSLRTDEITRYIIALFFFIGIVLAFPFNTWILAVPLGGLCMLVFFVAQYVAPHSFAARYIAACAYPIFTAQFIYQLHGAPEANLFYFLGATTLVLYQDWKLFLPSSIIFFIHLILFFNLQNGDPNAVHFELAKNITQLNIISVFAAGFVHTLFGIWIANILSQRNKTVFSNVGQINHFATENARQKQVLEQNNIALENQIEEQHNRIRELNDKLRQKDSDILQIKTQLTQETQTCERKTQNFLTEIQSLKLEQLALVSKKQVVESLFNSKRNCFIETDINGKILSLSTYWENYGFQTHALIGRNICELMNPEAKSKRFNLFAIEHNDTLLFEKELESQNNSDTELEWEINDNRGMAHSLKVSFDKIFDSNLQLIGYTCIAHDNSKNQILKAKIQELTNQASQYENTIQQNLDDLAEIYDELLLANRQTKESEHFLINIINHLPIALFVKEVNNQIPTESTFTLINTTAEQLFSLDQSAIGKSTVQIYDAERARLLDQEDELIIANPQIIELPNYTLWSNQVGEVIVNLKKIPIFTSEGKLKYLLGVAENVTKQVKANQLIHSIIESNPVPVIICNLETTIFLYANQRFSELIDVPLEQILNNSLEPYFFRTEKLIEIKQILLEQKTLLNYEVQLRKKSGQIFWGYLNFQLITIEEQLCLIGSVIDIHEQKLLNDKIAQSENWLNEAFEVANIGTWELDLKTLQMTFDSRHAKWLNGNLGKSTNGSSKTIDFPTFIDRFVDSKQISLFNNMIEELIKSSDTNPHSSFEYTLNIPHNNTIESKIILLKVRGVQDNLGNTIKCFATSQDITNVKLNQDTLADAKVRLKEALEVTSLSMWDFDTTNLILNYDSLHQSWFGLKDLGHEKYSISVENFLKNHVVPEDVSILTDTIGQLLGPNPPMAIDFDYRLQPIEGKIRILGVRVRVQLDEVTGKAIRVFGTSLDVTLQRSYEVILADTKAKLKEALEVTSVSMWDFDTTNLILNYDSLHQSWFGLKDLGHEKYSISVEEFLQNHVLSEDVSVLTDTIGQLLGPNPPMAIDFDYRLQPVEGKIRILGVRVRVQLDEVTGKAIRVFGTSLDVTLQRSYEVEIQRSNERFEAITTSVPGVIYQLILNEDGTQLYTYVSPAIERLIGITPKEVLEDATNLIEFIHPDDRDLSSEKNHAQKNEPFSRQIRLITKNGTTKYIVLNGQAQIINTTSLLINGVMTDVTDQENQNRQEQERQIRVQKQDEALVDLSKNEIITSGNLLLAFQFITEVVLETLDCARILIFYFEEDNCSARSIFGYDRRTFEYMDEMTIHKNDYPNYFDSILSDQVLAVQYANFDKRTKELNEKVLSEQGVNSLLVAPIRRGGSQIGYISVAYSGPARKWTDDEQSFISYIAEIINLAQEAAEKQQAFEKLQISDTTFNALQTNMPGVIFQTSLENSKFQFTFISSYITKLAGLESQNILEDPSILFNQIHPDDLENFQKAIIESLKQVSDIRWEGRGIKLSGEEFWIQVLGSSDKINENLTIGNGLILDITEQKNAELDREIIQERLLLQEAALSQLAKSPEVLNGEIEIAYPMITEAIASILEVERVSIWYSDSEISQIECKGLYINSDFSFSEPEIILTQELYPNYFEALATEKVIDASYALYDIRTSDFVKEYFPAYNIKSLLDVPIFSRGKLAGVVCCEQVGEPRKWQTYEIAFIQSIGEIISLGFEAYQRVEAFKLLQSKELELTELNNQLSETVDTRTQALEELKSAQKQLVQSEKMASLGQLVAGVAHEINTPISAVKASTRNLFRTLPVVLTEIPLLLSSLSEEDATLFIELVNQAVESNKDLTTQEERALRTEVKKILDEYDVDNSFELAKELVEVRIIQHIDRFINLFYHPDSSNIIDKVYKLGQFKKNMDNIEMAAEKTARVAKALKNYSRVQTNDDFIEVFLHESIDTILTIYDNQLKYGVSVEKNYQPMMKPVPVFPDEIGQVWTNIINNAVQAMKGKGKLSIDILTREEFAVVNISDNGPGIPEDIIKRIFEPFFTTKPEGEGTGLGLDICRKIVEKHNGYLTVESEPGKTVFTIQLPLVQKKSTNNE